MTYDPSRRRLFATGLGALGAAGIAGSTPAADGDAGRAGIAWARDRADVARMRFPADVVLLVLTQYDRSSPVCPARYERTAPGGEGPAYVRSLDGASWKLAEPVVDVAMLGAGGDAIGRAVATLDERPGTVRLRGERYRITTPLRLHSGQTLVGAGWASREDATIAEGSTILALDGPDACIEILGASPARPAERVGIAALAIVGNGSGKGIRTRDARHLEFDDLYLSHLGTGILWEETVWMGVYSRIQCFACQTGFDLNSGAEDSSFRNCIVRYADVACRINYHSQTNYFTGCDFGYARTAVEMIGSPGKRVNATFESCIFEFKPGDAAKARSTAIFELTAPASDNLLDYPSVSCRSCRFHAVDGTSGAAIFQVDRANLIAIVDCRAGTKMGTIVRCDDIANLGGVILSGNEEVARTVMTGDPRLGQRIDQLTPGAR